MLSRVRFVPLCIPFVQEFSHAQKSRAESDSFFLVLTSKDGQQGFGEALVRPYVTGETREAVSACLRDIILPRFASFAWDMFEEKPTEKTAFTAFQAAVDELCRDLPKGPLAWNGLRCVLELALLDLWLGRHALSLGAVMPPLRQEVVYSGILSASSLDKTLRAVRNFAQLGITELKLKVSSYDDIQLVREVIAQGGERLRLRLDANSAFDLPGAIAFVRALEGLPLVAIEQPMLRGDVRELAELQAQSSIPVMVDESLLSIEDAETLLTAKACRVFNIRLAKNGGIGPSLRLAELAQAAGISLQIGAMVGETALLSAVGRHLSAHLPEPLCTEGSFGSLLLKQDLARQSIRFGYGGKAPLLKAARFGVEILSDRLAQFTVAGEAWEVAL